MPTDSLEQLNKALLAFARQRDWEQFHSPKNLAMALAGEPVKLRNDGTFTVRMSMPDQRQIVPVVAQSRDGIEQRTTVLSINRNTKEMEPVIRDPSE